MASFSAIWFWSDAYVSINYAHSFRLGVQVGQVTVHEGTDIHTGLTVILPRGIKETRLTPCYAATHDLNGMGELTGTHALSEYGYINTARSLYKPHHFILHLLTQTITLANRNHQHRQRG